MSTLRWLPGADDDADGPRPRSDDDAHRRLHADEGYDPSGIEGRPRLPVAFALRGCAATLRAAGPGLRSVDVEHRAAALDRIGRSWRDPLDEHRREALDRLPAELDATPSSVAWALDRTFASWTRERFLSWWSRSPPGGRGVELSAHVWAGNVFTSGLPPVAASLLAGVPALIKAPGHLPTFAALFARSVVHHAFELGPCVGAAAWPRTDERATRSLLAADVAFAFGDAGSLDALAALGSAPLHRFGPRYSIAWAEESLAGGEEGLAHDVLAYDGQGCLTPKWLFVRSGLDSAVGVAKKLAGALERVATGVLPAPPLEAGPGAARAAWLASTAFDGWSVGGPGWAVAATPWAPDLSPPPRCLHVVPVASAAELASRLSPLGATLQGCALLDVDAASSELLDALSPLGVSRVVPAGELQRPPVDWIHDDVDPISILRTR